MKEGRKSRGKKEGADRKKGGENFGQQLGVKGIESRKEKRAVEGRSFFLGGKENLERERATRVGFP